MTTLSRRKQKLNNLNCIFRVASKSKYEKKIHNGGHRNFVFLFVCVCGGRGVGATSQVGPRPLFFWGSYMTHNWTHTR